jgi:hypothetical protein
VDPQIIPKTHQHHGKGGEDIGENRFLLHGGVTHEKKAMLMQ